MQDTVTGKEKLFAYAARRSYTFNLIFTLPVKKVSYVNPGGFEVLTAAEKNINNL